MTAAAFVTPRAVTPISGGTASRALPGWIAGLLAIPLAGKLAGASVIVFMVAIGVALGVLGNAPRNESMLLAGLGAAS